MKITFVKPVLETDAVWDSIRTCPYFGLWSLASLLKQNGHEVKDLDEVVRNGGLEKKTLFVRELKGNDCTETPINTTYEEFQIQKMRDYHELSPVDFVKKYSAFNEKGKVCRTMVRTGNTDEETLKEVTKNNPDFVGIPLIATANYLPATRIAKKIKEALPKTKIIFGGQHVSATPLEFLEQNPYVDHIITGDAITTINNLVDGKDSRKIISGGIREMNDFPLLDPSIIEINGYPLEPTYTYSTNGRKSIDFMFSKGCFRKCSFCVAGCQKGSHITAAGYNKIDEQLKIFKQHNVEELVVQDDAFLVDPIHRKEHLQNILGLMKKHGFYWQNNGGVEFEALDDEVTNQLIQYNKSGQGRVTSLYVPFNPRAWNKQDSAAKSMSQRYHQNLENLKRLREDGGIYIFTSSIIGTPDQTRETFEDELQTDKSLVLDGYIDAALCLSATMLPGTVWFKENRHNIINEKDYAGYSLFATHHQTDNLSPQEIEEFMVRWPKEFEPIQKNHKWGTAFPNV